MGLYRVHERLLVDRANGVFVEGGPGCVSTLSMVSKRAIGILLANGAISEVQAPPLAVFTGWRGRARELDALGIDTIAFITMDARDVAYAMRARRRREDEEQEEFDRKVGKLAQAVERWQCEIREFLGIDDADVRR